MLSIDEEQGKRKREETEGWGGIVLQPFIFTVIYNITGQGTPSLPRGHFKRNKSNNILCCQSKKTILNMSPILSDSPSVNQSNTRTSVVIVAPSSVAVQYITLFYQNLVSAILIMNVALAAGCKLLD